MYLPAYNLLEILPEVAIELDCVW